MFDIPEEHASALVQMLSLGPEQFDALKTALENAEPSFRATEFAQRVGTSVGLPAGEVRDLVAMLLSMYASAVENAMGPKEFSTEIIEAGADFLEGQDLHQAVERLTSLLRLDKSVGMTARAAEIGQERPNLYCRARILTDMRPVYGPTAQEIVGGFEVHTLILHYHVERSHSDVGVEEFFLSLDRRNLLDLRRSIDRALIKGQSLERLATRAEVPWLQYGGTDNEDKS